MGGNLPASRPIYHTHFGCEGFLSPATTPQADEHAPFAGRGIPWPLPIKLSQPYQALSKLSLFYQAFIKFNQPCQALNEPILFKEGHGSEWRQGATPFKWGKCWGIIKFSWVLRGFWGTKAADLVR